MISAIRRHFDQQSDRYTTSSGSFLWRWQRRREIAVVASMSGQMTGKEVLDLGCGSGHYTRYSLAQGARHITAVDFSPFMISQLPKSNVTGMIDDATKIRLEKKFPIIICAGLLEFVSSPVEVLHRARALIENDGHMVCLLPPDNWASRLYRSYHRRHKIEINLFPQSYFRNLCGDTGWGVDAFQSIFPYTNVYRLTPRRTL